MEAKMYDLKREKSARSIRTITDVYSQSPMVLAGLELMISARLWSVTYVGAMVRFHVSLLSIALSQESKPLKSSVFPY